MYDFDLQLKFWRGMTDAMLHGTQATLAAASEMQDQFLSANANPPASALARLKPLSMAPSSAYLWWFDAWQSAMTAMMTGAGTAMPGSGSKPFSATNPFFNMTPSFAMTRQPATAWPMMPQLMSQTGNPWATWMSMWGQGPAAALGPFAAIWPWSAMGWNVIQTPMTAMMMSAGVPYKVASPSAKASTAAMDAAHAARQQMDKMYSAYRSDGGHAAAQIALMPWTIAASLLETQPDISGKGAKPGTKSGAKSGAKIARH